MIKVNNNKFKILWITGAQAMINAAGLCPWNVVQMNSIVPEVFDHIYTFTVSFTGHRPAQQGTARTELIGPCEVPSPTPTPKTRPDQHTGNSMPYSLRLMCGFFNVPQGYEHSSVVRRDLRFIVLIRED